MTAPVKFLYYSSRIIHLLLLPMLYIGIVWFLEDKWWEVVGLLLLFTIPFNQFIIRNSPTLLLVVRLMTYIAIIMLFFPNLLFSKEYALDYKNIILYDMCFLAIADLAVFFDKKESDDTQDKE